MKKFICLFVFMIMMLSSTCFAKLSIPDSIRVGIYSGTRAVSSLTISSKTGMEIGTVDEDGEFELIESIKAGKEVSIKKGKKSNSVYVDGIGDVGDNENYLRIIPSGRNDDLLLNVSAVNYSGVLESNNYRGEIEIRRFSTSDMTVINELSMQEYLYGVVPREIGGNSPIEAVKAQAIIARTYAAKNYNKRYKWDFNLTNTVDDQAYGGYNWENPNSNAAVDETYGMVATYDGELIGGYYFSTSGGYTESSENVWGGEVSYLEAVPDPYEPDNLSKTTWTVNYTAEDIENLLAKKGIDIGNVTNMVVNKFSDAGRVLELEIIGTDGTYTASKSAARTLLNLNSQWYTINDDEPMIPKYTLYTDEKVKNDEEDDNIKEEKEMKPLLKRIIDIVTMQKIEDTESNDNTNTDEEMATSKTKYLARKTKVDSFEIKGRGWGHSVGMSQNGAIGMAKNDFTCEEIIKWYYKGVEIAD